MWLGEYYHRIEKLPSIQEVIDMVSPNKQVTETEMSDDDMLAMARKLNAQYGGKEVEVE